MTVAAATKSNVVTVIPKINSSVHQISAPTKINTSLASATVTLASNATNSSSKQIKRINPIKISDVVSVRASSIEKSSDSDVLSRDSLPATNDERVTSVQQTSNGDRNRGKRPPPQGSRQESPPPKRAVIVQSKNPSEPLNSDFQELIKACKTAESGNEMTKIVQRLVKYYRRAHRDYVQSKEFRSFVRNVTHHVKTKPGEMYQWLIDLLEELKTRRTNDDVPTAAAADAAIVPTVVDPVEQEKEQKRAKQIKKLNQALRNCQEQIRKYEQDEVDWNDEYNSTYIVAEKLKERAYKIYLKLCELTGEKRDAKWNVQKPIKFNGTPYEQFNKKLENFVNNYQFPDMFDVLKIMGHCNEKFNYRLDRAQQQSIGKRAHFFSNAHSFYVCRGSIATV